MKRKLKSWQIIVVVIFSMFGIWYYYNFVKYAPSVYVKDTIRGLETINTVNNTTSSTTPKYLLSDVVMHKDEKSCYSVINGNVYDLTMWINLHPGGKDRILSICGIDGTEKFMNKHKGGQKFMNILSRFRIGVLSQ